MEYTKNNKRYHPSRLSGLKGAPEDHGFMILDTTRPNINKFEEFLIEKGVSGNKVVYEIVRMTEDQKSKYLKKHIKLLKKRLIDQEKETFELFEQLNGITDYKDLNNIL